MKMEDRNEDGVLTPQLIWGTTNLLLHQRLRANIFVEHWKIGVDGRKIKPSFWGNSPAASSIPVGCEMIQICLGCQSLQKITCFEKNDGITLQTLAVSRYSRWRSRWPTNHTCSFFSGTIDHTDVILVSYIGFLGSENPNNIFSLIPNYHVTLKV